MTSTLDGAGAGLPVSGLQMGDYSCRVGYKYE